MMKQDKKQKQLEMALINHKDLIIDIGDNYKYKLTWDEEINNYRGWSLQSQVDFGIWKLEFLLDVANGKEREYQLEVCYE